MVGVLPVTSLFALALLGQAAAKPQVKMQGPDDPPVTTSKSISLDGTPFPYTATFGLIPLRDDQGGIEARMSFTAYCKEGVDPATRPIVFCYNGGPGSATLWLHLGTIGPRRVALNDDGSMPKPPFRLVDNSDTWLREADVVLIDAPNTGIGRIAKPEYGSRFFGVRQDLQAFTRFIRNYLTQYERWRSPVFLAGESYGGVRTAGLAKSLYDDGIAINGAIVVSGLMNYGTVRAGAGNDVPYEVFLPTFAQTAWYHKKLAPAWQNRPVEEVAKTAEAFAAGPYQEALFKGTALTDAEKKAVATKYAELTGLSREYVLRSNLRVSEGRFFKELLRDRGQTVGRFDGRLLGVDRDDAGEDAEYDPSDAAIEAPFSSTIVDLITRELNYRSETPYKTWGDIGRWENPQGTYADTSENLRQAMSRNPYFKIMFAVGRYDMACPYYGTKYTIDHMGLRPDQLKRVEWKYYPSGHMIYIDRGSRERLTKDVDAFIRANK